MKLRIARKMDQKPKHHGRWLTDEDRNKRDHGKRKWWTAYNVEQLKCAEQRLWRSWRTACPPYEVIDDKGEAWMYRKLTPDYHRAYRVESRRIRQAALKAHRKQKL